MSHVQQEQEWERPLLLDAAPVSCWEYSVSHHPSEHAWTVEYELTHKSENISCSNKCKNSNTCKFYCEFERYLVEILLHHI